MKRHVVVLFKLGHLYRCRMVEEIRLPSGRVLKYLKWAEVAKLLQERGFAGDSALREIGHSDLTTHVYEGGFKVSRKLIANPH